MTRKRRVLLILLFGVVLVALVAIGLPLWFPWLLRPALRHFGVQYRTYERVGYTRFALIDTTFDRDAMHFGAARLETFLPPAWWWHQRLGHTNRLFLQLSGWRFEQATPENAASARRANQPALPADSLSVYRVVDQVQARLPALRTWVPRARLTGGTVRAGTNEFTILELEWQDGHLKFEAARPGGGPPIRFEGDFTARSSWLMHAEDAEASPPDLAATLRLTQTPGAVAVAGVVKWRTNQFSFQSQFPRVGWLPSEASLKSDSFRVAATDLRLPGYSDLTGSISAQWKTNRLALDLSARAHAFAPKSPDIALILRANGDTNSFRIEECTVNTSFLQASLSPGTEIARDGGLLSGDSRLHFQADLSQQPWFASSGQVIGEIQFHPAARKYPDAFFQLAGRDLAGFKMEVRNLTANGFMRWPRVEVQKVAIQLPDNTAAQASLSLNLISRMISDGRLQLTSSGRLPLLPSQYAFEGMSARADFAGPPTNLAHSVTLDVTNLHLPKLEPVNLSISSRGQQRRVEHFEAQLAARTSKVKLAGAAELPSDGLKVRLETLTVNQRQRQLFALAQPFDLLLQRLPQRGNQITPRCLVRASPFEWSGENRQVTFTASSAWPDEGAVRATLHNVSLTLFQDFITQRLPQLAIDELTVAGGWTNGPASFQLDLKATLMATNALPFSVALNAASIPNGVRLNPLAVSDATNVIFSGQGTLPITVNPQQPQKIVRVDTRQPIEFRAATKPNRAFWTEMSKWTRLRLEEPALELAVSGTLESPRGHIGVMLASVEIPARDPDRKWPRLDRLTADLDIVPGRLRLHNLRVFVENQPIQATGDVPFSTDFSLPLKKIVDVQNASARVKIDRARLEPFASFFPKYVSPQGELRLDLAVEPGLHLGGALVITNAATRPLPPLGTVQDISARLKFAGQRVQLENFTGFFGGEPLVVSGAVDFAQRHPQTDLPQFALQVRGQNIPLARQPELILRSDLDLSISNLTNAMPVVGGSVHLRDSFFLADLKLLVPGRVAAPSRRPPYFSIGTEPLSNWRLALHVTGDRFLNVRTPFFRGSTSANLELQGTLREPLAIGSVRIYNGTVQFPFANLRVDQGLVTLTSDNPYRPQLQVNATARTFGYDIKMEVTGAADDPIVQFSSVPALSSEQIVLLLTTGEVPGNRISFSTQQRAGSVAMFVGKNLLSKLTGGEGDTDRLTIRSGESIAENGKQTYYIEYKLSDDWSLVGEYDRFSAFNAGIKWRFYSK